MYCWPFGGRKKGELAMGDRAAGVLRWGEAERRLVRQYLEDGRLDATRVGSASYLKRIMDKEDVWKRHPAKNFYQNVRRMANQYQVDQERKGGCRRNDENKNEDNNDDGEDDGDDDKEEDNEDDDEDAAAAEDNPPKTKDRESLM